MVQLILVALLLIMAQDAYATRYWGSPSGSDATACSSIDGDDDPGVYRATPQGVIACMAGGDTGTMKAGVYTGTKATIRGLLGGTVANPTIFEGDPSSQVGCAFNAVNPTGVAACPTIFRPSSGALDGLVTVSHVIIRKLDLDHVNATSIGALGFEVASPASITDFLVEDIYLHDTGITNSSITCGSGDGFGTTPGVRFATFRRVHVYNVGNHDPANVCGHGFYLSGDDMTVEYSLVRNAANAGLQCYTGHATSDGRSDRCTVRYSEFRDSGAAGVLAEGNDNQIYGNYIHDNGAGILLGYSGALRAKVYNNTILNNDGSGIQFRGSADDGFATNNIIFGNTLAIEIVTGATNNTLSYNACSSAQSCGSTGKRTISAITDCTVSTSDVRQKSGSSCINSGIVISGFNYNGSAPDIGAYESVPNPVCSITTNVITCIFPMSLNVPIQNLSTTGVTVGCTGSACPGSPTASAVGRVVGTDTHVEITVAGITGNACEAANQTFDLTYNSATGSWTDNANIGVASGIYQKIFSFTSLAVTNQCTGAAASGYPAGYHIYYAFEDGSGTNVNDGSANNLDCTFTNTPTWGAGKTGGGMVVAAASTQHCAIPWGSGVNPYSTDLTIVAPVLIAVGTESSTHFVFGPSLGTNQRFYVCSYQGTWRISYQSVSCSNTSASNLAVTSGWDFLVVRTNSATHTATLSKNGVAGTGGASVTLTSFTLASNMTLGRVGSQPSLGGTYDDFLVYLSLQDPVVLYAAFQATAPPAGGTFAQAAIQAQGVYLDSTGAVRSFGALNSAIETVTNGGVSLVFQVHCQDIANCDETGFKLVYTKNQTAATAASAGTLLAVPNVETSDGTWFWGNNPATGLNNGTTTTRLTGTCTVTNGATQLTADQVPSVDLPQDGCVMLRYIVKIGDVAGSYFEYRLLTQAGLPLDGGYAADARVTVVNPRASGVGF